MKNLLVTLLMLLSFAFTNTVMAQEKASLESKDTTYWKNSFSQGLNILQLAVINPKIGSGVNILSLGGDISLSAIYDSDKIYWINQLNWQFGVQRLGAGKLLNGGSIPFTKSLDLLTFTSDLYIPFKPKSSLYYGGFVQFLSQGLPTFQGNLLVDNTPDNSGKVFSKLLSPAQVEIAPAIAYVSKNKKINITYSPISYKAIIVADDSIAALGVHGNPVERLGNEVISYENIDNQFGSFLGIVYRDAFFDKKLTLNTRLSLYSNYFNHPERIDVIWNADIGVKLFKKVQFALKLNLLYDYDIQILQSDSNRPMAEWELGRGVNFTEQLIIRYKLVF